MANINDYLGWRGDITLKERYFNDADNLILACLSYFDFSGIVPSEESHGIVALSKACRALLAKSGGDVRPFVRSVARLDSRFLELLADSQRFGSSRLSSYVDIMDEERSLQFSALQIDLPTHETYVSFRGTDSTIIGWREDFMLSFEVTEAQREAQRYLERAIRRAVQIGNRVLVGGHSKGGNLAQYAAVNCPEELREHIIRVYSNDGPGMAPELLATDAHSVLGDRMRYIVPTYSIIGMLFARAGDRRKVVASKGMGIGQHDPSTWQVLRTGVKEANGLARDCVLLNESIAKWADGIPLDERERVINEVFDALSAGGATRFEDIVETTEGLQKVIRALSATDDRTRDLALALVEGTVDSSVDAMRKAARKTLDQWKKNATKAVGDAARKLFGDVETKATT